MYLVAGAGGSAIGLFPQAALEEKARNDRDVLVTRRADYLARTSGRRSLPWRIVMIADDDRQLLLNQMVYLLAAPSRLTDVAWIKPGKVSWDWFNNLNLRGVSFRAGVNNDTYKYFIDFASKNGIPYIILDEGMVQAGRPADAGAEHRRARARAVRRVEERRHRAVDDVEHARGADAAGDGPVPEVGGEAGSRSTSCSATISAS